MESEKELLALLESLDNFELTQNLSNRFNIFDAVNMGRHEIRHSRFLACLLDPSQPHGLDDRFLKATILAAANNRDDPPISKLQLAIADCTNSRVYSERDHFDISIEVPSLKLLFVIENKIGAEERKNQLFDYRNTAKNLYADHIFFGCFLNSEGYNGEDAEWAALSYSTIAEILKKIKSEGGIAPDALVAIDHYIELIEKKIMPSKELIEACKQIYRQHRTALDLIYEHGSESLLGQAFLNFKDKHPELGEALTLRKGYLSFISSSWSKVEGFSIADQGKWDASCPIKFWFHSNSDKLYLKLEVGPIIDDNGFDRGQFVAKLREALNQKETKRKSDIYTRILNTRVKFDEDAEVDEITASLEKLWENINGDDVIKRVEDIAKECLKK